jgi:hypothetical protein
MAEKVSPTPITEEVIRKLIEAVEPPVVTAYIPTVRGPVQPQENSLQLRDLLRRVEGRLEDAGLSRRDIDDLLEPLVRLLDDDRFWRDQLDGLALVRDMRTLQAWRLPFSVPAVISVEDAPAIRHLLRAVYPRRHVYVLALSQHAVRLFHANHLGIRELSLDDVDIPRSVDDALRYDDLQKPELQHHPTTGPGRAHEGRAATPQGHGGRRHAFHGHGESGEDEKTQIRRFLQAVDNGIAEFLSGTGAPLLLAAVENVAALYRQVSRHGQILDEVVEGSPDRLSEQRLHDRSLPIIERYTRRRLQEVRDAYGAAGGAGLATSDAIEVLAAAHEGRIRILLVASDAALRGRFDPTTREIDVVPEGPSPGAGDLVEEACRTCVMTSSEVYVLDPDDMVEDGSLAAILRY